MECFVDACSLKAFFNSMLAQNFSSTIYIYTVKPPIKDTPYILRTQYKKTSILRTSFFSPKLQLSYTFSVFSTSEKRTPPYY